jgi:hypothetical protein
MKLQCPFNRLGLSWDLHMTAAAAAAAAGTPKKPIILCFYETAMSIQ